MYVYIYIHVHIYTYIHMHIKYKYHTYIQTVSCIYIYISIYISKSMTMMLAVFSKFTLLQEPTWITWNIGNCLALHPLVDQKVPAGTACRSSLAWSTEDESTASLSKATPNCKQIWVNYNDFTATEPWESWFLWWNHPQMALVQVSEL